MANSLEAVQTIVHIPFAAIVLVPVAASAVLCNVTPVPCTIVLVPPETLKTEIISPAVNMFWLRVRAAPLPADLITFPASPTTNTHRHRPER